MEFLNKILKPITSPTAGGVSTRYITVMITTTISVLSIMGVLDKEQSEFIKTLIPEFIGAISGAVAIGLTIYAALKKSQSPSAEAVGKEIDAGLTAGKSVEVKTPEGAPNIIVKEVK